MDTVSARISRLLGISSIIPDSNCKLSCPRFECSMRKLIEGEVDWVEVDSWMEPRILLSLQLPPK
jgi:hypothetical protein